MAIGKKLSDPLRVVSVQCDDAIDWSKTSKLDYIEKRDEKMVAALPGEQLCWFTIKPLPPGLVANITSLPGNEAKYRAFRFGVTDCSDPNLGLKWNMKADYPFITDMDEVPMKLWIEIGGLIIQREELSEGEEPRFVLSRS